MILKKLFVTEKEIISVAEFEKLVDDYEKLSKKLTQYNQVIRKLTSENYALAEIAHLSMDIMAAYNPITIKYHAMIFKGEATPEDMMKCSNIMQKIIRMKKEFDNLVNLTQDMEKMKEIESLDLSIIK